MLQIGKLDDFERLVASRVRVEQDGRGPVRDEQVVWGITEVQAQASAYLSATHLSRFETG